MLWGDLDAIREEMIEEARAKQQVTLILNTSHLTGSDTALFSNGANEITAQRNSTVSIAYKLDDSSYNKNKWFAIDVNGNIKYQTTVPGTGTLNYTVNPADANNNNVITIFARSEHSNPYEIGDTGPAGGKIIYHDPNGFIVQGYGNPGDNGYFAEYTAFYLEAAPADASVNNTRWSNTLISIPNLSQNADDTTDWAIGRGRLNTAIIIAANPAETTVNNAAKQAAAYTNGGKNDWFLPSRDELNLIYIQRSHVDIITTREFWSSSQYGNGHAWSQNFNNGSQFNGSKTFNFHYVRAVRAF